eukprot:5468430-Pleurochrysis_carterae.AAC.1
MKWRSIKIVLVFDEHPSALVHVTPRCVPCPAEQNTHNASTKRCCRINANFRTQEREKKAASP